MQYLLNDLIKLPLSERLTIIEFALCSLSNQNSDWDTEKNAMVNKIKLWKYESAEQLIDNNELKSVII